MGYPQQAEDLMPHFLAHIDPDKVTMGQLYAVILLMRNEQKDTLTKLQEATDEISDLKTEFSEYKESQKDMLETWSTARGVLKFIKLLAAIGLPVSAILALVGIYKSGTN